MNEERPFLDATVGRPTIRGYLHTPSGEVRDGLALTHGAGSDCRSKLLTALGEAFCSSGLLVLRFDLPFRQARPHGPPYRGSAERDQEGIARSAEILRASGVDRVFLAGHSYGGRQASMLAAARPETAEALLLLSYPLHPLKRPEEKRIMHFPELRIPTCFFHGSRDAMGSVAEIREALPLIPAATSLEVVEGAGHELVSARTIQTVVARIVHTFLQFCNDSPAGVKRSA